MEADERLRVDGAVIFWALAEFTDRVQLNNGLTAVGYGGFEVEQRTAVSVLRDAVENVHSEHPSEAVLVRPLKRHGWCVSREKRDDEENAYGFLTSYRLEDLETIRCFGSIQRHKAVEMEFAHLRDTLRAPQVSAMLVKILAHLQGVRLNPNGFVYWLPERGIHQWQLVCAAVGAAGMGVSQTYVIRHRFDKDALIAVKDGITREAEREAAEISKDVASGTLARRALDGRALAARTLRTKVGLYETLLNETLTGLKSSLDKAEQAAVLAVMLASIEGEAA